MDDNRNAPRGTVDTYFAPIHSAARIRDTAEVRRQLELGVDVDLPNGRASNGDGGNTALWFAAQGPPPCGLEIARLLIECGADPNQICEHGSTALHIASAWGHPDMTKLLLANGADQSIQDIDGKTPLDRVISSTRAEKELQLRTIKLLRQSPD